jgi:hypothetical protein
LTPSWSFQIDNDDYVNRALKGEITGESSKPPKGSSKREEKKDKEPREKRRVSGLNVYDPTRWRFPHHLMCGKSSHEEIEPFH